MPTSRFRPPDPPPELAHVSALEMTPVQAAHVFMSMVYRSWTITEQTKAEDTQTLDAFRQLAYVRWLRSTPDEAETATAQQDSAP